MTEPWTRKAARDFAERWKGKGYEKGQSQPFWLALLRDVCGAEKPEELIQFEDQVHLDHTSFIDGYIPSTQVLIEQKSIGRSLDEAIRQSDGSMLTPFEQAKRYSCELPYSMRPRWVVTCNFEEFRIYDMEDPQGQPETIRLADLDRFWYRLQFLVNADVRDIPPQELELSVKAGELVGELYDAVRPQYRNPDSEATLQSLNKLIVRLVFLLYSEDTEIFGGHLMFHDYLQEHRKEDRRALINLFRVLDTRPKDRDPYLDDDLARFPYVNGELFAGDIEVPRLGDEVIRLILDKASAGFDWSGINPTIFGALFESTLNPETRRAGGMHYTSLENIHKILGPLFLDELSRELEEIEATHSKSVRTRRLKAFQDKLASLVFLDPACGSGNFLTSAYRSLRMLENRVIADLHKGQAVFGEYINPIKVSIGQFYGIEINDFAVAVARTALWVAEAQLMRETEGIVNMRLDFLPLKSYPNIVEGNALRMDWGDVVDCGRLDYIIGNPPFIGYSNQTREQKKDILSIYCDEQGKPYKAAGKIDYVAGWFFKAAEFIQGTDIRVAFVATNSITQGEQVASVWKPLFRRFGIHIDFAHRSFRWDSEASKKAHVHCVIVAFSVGKPPATPRIYTNGQCCSVERINPYLLDAPHTFVEKRTKALCDVPAMITGNRPADGGHLIIEARDYDDFVAKEPAALPYIKRLMGSSEFINDKKRWCLWLAGANPADLRRMPLVMERVRACKEDREASPDAGRRKLAETPTLFRETNNPDAYILVPEVSSERRRYVPMGLLDGSVIPTNLTFIVPGATLYHFGVLTSSVHMAWMRAVCGRLETRYRYSRDIVYNTFPWPQPTPAQMERIQQTARAILDARALYPGSSLADLYDELAMPPELRAAHRRNDRAVMAAYGFPAREMAEADCVAMLMRMYQDLTATDS